MVTPLWLQTWSVFFVTCLFGCQIFQMLLTNIHSDLQL